MNDLINSGNLGIIRYNQLRNRLPSWTQRLDDLNLRQKANKEFENLIIRYIIDNESWLVSVESSTDLTVKKLNCGL